MKSLLSLVFFFSFFVFCLSAATFDPKSKDLKGRLVEAKRHRRSAADLRKFHQRQRAIKKHKNYVPYWPAEPITTFINIGDSEQFFFVSQESGVDSVFVLDVSYPSLVPGQAFYDPNNSSGVYSGYFRGQTGDFAVYGVAYTDTVDFLGPVNQTFGSIQGTYDGRFYDPEFVSIDGVFGLAWDPSKKDDPVTPESAPILNLFASKPNASRHFTQFVGGLNGDWDLSFTLFGDDLDTYCIREPVVSAPLFYNEAASSVVFQLDSVSLGGESADGDVAKVDSGLPTILLPWQAFNILYDQLNPGYDYNVGIYTTDCSNAALFDDFVVVINGVELRVPAINYVIDLELGGNKCALGFEYTNELNTPYALGLPFSLSYCVKHDIDNTQLSFLSIISEVGSSTVAI